MKDYQKIIGLTAVSLALGLSPTPVRANNIGLDPSLQNKFSVREFATGLNFPNGIAQLNDGSLVVGTTNGNSFFDSNAKGQLVRLQDNGSGVATKTILYDGTLANKNLPGGITAISTVNDYLFVTGGQGNSRNISVFQTGADLGANSLTLKGALDFSFPNNYIHSTYSQAVRQTGAGQFDLYFNIGGATNNTATPMPSGVTVSSAGFNLPSTQLNGDALYKIPFSIDPQLNFGQPVQVGTGLRNAAALAFDPADNLYIGDNGIDGLPPAPANNATTTDALYRLTPAQLASGTVYNFGFPNSGAKAGSPGVFVDGNGSIVTKDPSALDALAYFQPIPDPTTGFKSQGVDAIAPAPTTFPTGFNNGAFVAFFGRFNAAPGLDSLNPVLYYDAQTGQYQNFLSTNQGGDYGHFTSLLSTQNSLFAVDIASSGFLFNSSGLGSGTIYQISAAQTVPEPSNLLGIGIAIGAGVYLKRKTKLARRSIECYAESGS
ncbi:PEP-CTERM sorting domain-containing protein [Chamaesiphon sp. VAR_48_metabat_403]|uniref:PEP-CTERM sorting domain-containing protein n=1 Tax=Chamaesiphon sp. VAR_48_metabat_403 TaxID=2964700 RepID=UPI00286E6315|nr:PEP-CTERM sorting domain-containing protein [Chamaesiphon sp. VAR_48_metabat_403]